MRYFDEETSTLLGVSTGITPPGIPGYKNVYPHYHVPKIGGQNYDYLVAALTEYKTGHRKHPTMQAQGESLSDQDIRDIAAWISSVEVK